MKSIGKVTYTRDEYDVALEHGKCLTEAERIRYIIGMRSMPSRVSEFEFDQVMKMVNGGRSIMTDAAQTRETFLKVMCSPFMGAEAHQGQMDARYDGLAAYFNGFAGFAVGERGQYTLDGWVKV